jgi:hypothetical protein
MSYQQPPGGYPQQGGYQQPQQQAQQGYQMDPNAAYRAPMGAGAAAPPAAMIQLIGLGLVALGSVLRGIVGLMKPSSGAIKTYNIAGLFMALGLLALFYGLLNTALKDKEVPAAVRVAIVIASVVALVMGYYATAGFGGGGGPNF